MAQTILAVRGWPALASKIKDQQTIKNPFSESSVPSVVHGIDPQSRPQEMQLAAKLSSRRESIFFSVARANAVDLISCRTVLLLPSFRELVQVHHAKPLLDPVDRTLPPL